MTYDLALNKWYIVEPRNHYCNIYKPLMQFLPSFVVGLLCLLSSSRPHASLLLVHIFKALITVYNCCKLHFIFLKLLVIIVVNQIRKARAEPTVFENPSIKNSHFTSLRAKRAAFFTACLNIHVNIPMRLF